MKMLRLVVFSSLLFLLSATALPQFRNRYPKVEGYNHHIYLEGYELPILNAGPVDAVASPIGHELVFAAHGWLWRMDLATRRAVRLTTGADVDARPTWSPDGTRIAFVRDSSSDTTVVERDLSSGEERILADTTALDLDPAYGASGQWLFYSSAIEGDLDLWRVDLQDGTRERLTSDSGLELKPLPTPDGQRVVYLSKSRSGGDRIVELHLETGQTRTLKTVAIGSQMRPALGPAGRTLVVGLPEKEDWHLWLLDPGETRYGIRLTKTPRMAISPAWGPDGTIYFSEADREQTFQLFAMPSAGGSATPIEVAEWDWGAEDPHLLTIVTRTRYDGRPLAARLNVEDVSGHPLIPGSGQVRFDSQSGKTYFYSDGAVQVVAPEGRVRITATHGFRSPPLVEEVEVDSSRTVEIDFELLPDPAEQGWFAGDHHFHLNYGGPYTLIPEDLVLPLQAEDMDVATPLAANLHNRLSDLRWWDWERKAEPRIQFGQEVRSHFLGHLGLIGIREAFWPWFWGPGYPAYGRDDRPNEQALKHARNQGGVAFYVHPVSIEEPFEDQEAMRSIPLNLVADAVLGNLDALELACLWSDEIGTMEVWYRLLNLGIPIAPSAGTDAFPDFYRSMAVGTTRVYVRPEGPLNWNSYLSGLRQGRSFVTNGPILYLTVAGSQPGEIVTGSQEVEWQLRVETPVPVETVELVVNGTVVQTLPSAEIGGTSFNIGVPLPEAGWVAARVRGSSSDWPLMDSYAFAHTAPIWIGTRGSSDSVHRREAARELLEVLEMSRQRLREGYEGRPAALHDHLDRAAARLRELGGGRP